MSPAELHQIPVSVLVMALQTHPQFSGRRDAHTDFARIISLTASIFGVTPDSLTGPRGASHVNRSRMAAMDTLRELGAPYGISVTCIAGLFARKEHSCVINARRQVTKLHATNPTFAANLRTLREAVALTPDPPRVFSQTSVQSTFRESTFSNRPTGHPADR